MVQVIFYFGSTGSQQVIWDTKKWEIKNPHQLAIDWQNDLGATRFSLSKISTF